VAYWLHSYGFKPTIIERRPSLTDEGYMIDFYGSGFDVADKMGLVDSLKERQYPISELVVVDDKGHRRASMKLEQFRKMLDSRYLNLMRGDIEMAIYDSVKDDVPIMFNSNITAIQGQADGIVATFSDGSTQTFDLLVGAGGIHSHTREILWGSESRFEHFLGFYVACAIVDDTVGDPNFFKTCIEPGRQAAVYSIRNNRFATFLAFKSDRLGYLSNQGKMAVLRRVFGEAGWIIPQILDAVEKSSNLFFDAVAQIKLEDWYKGRVVLVGDACQCLTLLAGQGASMAMAGAYILADHLNMANGNYQIAYPRHLFLTISFKSRRHTCF
jgi:2-polyprenyl-6-methoxyphenol hydroxylase-like FAD-dependent oxidoreductase